MSTYRDPHPDPDIDDAHGRADHNLPEDDYAYADAGYYFDADDLNAYIEAHHISDHDAADQDYTYDPAYDPTYDPAYDLDAVPDYQQGYAPDDAPHYAYALSPEEEADLVRQARIRRLYWLLAAVVILALIVTLVLPAITLWLNPSPAPLIEPGSLL